MVKMNDGNNLFAGCHEGEYVACRSDSGMSGPINSTKRGANIHRLAISGLALGVVLMLAGCNDEAKLTAAVRLGSDGVAAAQAYSDYVQTTATIYAKQCDLENFSDMLNMRRNKMPLANEQNELAKCASDQNRQETIADLKKWSQDGAALEKVYAALANLAGSANDKTVATAVNSLTQAVASAAKLNVSSGVGKAIDDLSTALVDHRTAAGVEAFAQVMAQVPSKLAKTLQNQQNAIALDGVYSVYDMDLKNAINTAYVENEINPTPALTAFYSTLGIQMPAGLQKDPYAVAFARTLAPNTVAQLGTQEREKIIGMLQKLSQETAQLQKLSTQGGSFREQVDEAKALRSKVNSVVDVSGSGK